VCIELFKKQEGETEERRPGRPIPPLLVEVIVNSDVGADAADTCYYRVMVKPAYQRRADGR
jgi:hypothetical protein